MQTRPKVVVVMPAYNAAKTLEKTYNEIPRDVVDRIILVDDVSQDATVEIARRLGLKVIIHSQNRGYGGNQKTCYLGALRDGADVVVMLHPDYQYDSRLLPELIAPIVAGQADLVLGSRFLHGDPLASGMPFWRYVANRFLTIIENAVLGQHLSECHTGFRAYSRRLLSTIPFVLNSDKFVFDTQVIAQAVALGFTIAEVPVSTRYFAEASSVSFRDSVAYGFGTLFTMIRFLLDRWGVAPSRLFHQHLSGVIGPYNTASFPGSSPAKKIPSQDCRRIG